MSENGPPVSRSNNPHPFATSNLGLGTRKPEAFGEAIIQHLADPSVPAATLARTVGLAPSTVAYLEKRLATDLNETAEAIRPLAVADIEKRITKRLAIMDKFLTEDVLTAKMEKAGLKDLGIYEGIFMDKLLTIKGQPNAILRVEDSMKIDQLGTAILKEIQNRGLSAAVTERKVEVALGATPATADASKPA